MPQDDEPQISAEPSDLGGRPAVIGSSRTELSAIAFERSATPMMIAEAGNAGNPVLFANRAFLDLTGYSLEEVVGRDCRYLQGPGTSREAINEISSAIKAEREVKVTLLNYRKDGTEFWNQLHISPIRDDSGAVIHYFASQSDVTETRRVAILEASERRLLKEVDHRAKNLMAVIDSIVRLSRSDDPDRYANSVRARVRTLSDVHMLLAEKGWSSVALDELIGQQIRAIGSSAVQISGPPMAINATDAQPVALIIHELAANAMIHGSLAALSGSVRITWRKMETEGCEIVWQERGRSTPVVVGKPGFGTVMVDALVERQLKGSIQREWNESGLDLVISLPGRQATLVSG